MTKKGTRKITTLVGFKGFSPSKPSHLVSLLAAGLVTLSGMFILAGWGSGNLNLVRIHPSFGLMSFNTAFGFFLGGAGLAGLILGKKWLATWMGVGLLVLGVLGVLQNIFDFNSELNNLWADSAVLDGRPVSPRMGQNVSLLFLLYGFSLSGQALVKSMGRFYLTAEFIGMLILAVSAGPFLGFLLGQKDVTSWPGFSGLAFHTAIGLLILALGLLGFIWGERKGKIAHVPLWVPILLLFVVLAFDIVMPLGVAAGVAYVPLVFCSLWFKDRNVPFLFAGVASVLTLLGFFFSVDIGVEPERVFLNRGLSILAIWVTAFVVYLQKKTEFSLRASEKDLEKQRNFQKAVEQTMIDGLAVINTRGKILQANQAMSKIFGYSEKEMVGRKINMLMAGEDKRDHDKYIQRYLKTGKAKIIGKEAREVVGIGKGGKKIDLELAVSTTRIGGKKIFVGSLRDITERKRALEETLAEVEQFAYVASHDLRAPLRAIDNLSQWIEEDLEGRLEGETKENMGLLRSRVKRLEKLLDDILRYSRAGRILGDLTTIDSHKLASEMSELLDIPKGFQVRIKGKLPKLEAPEGMLEQIFTNLINNAFKHHDKKRGEIILSARDKGQSWEFSVADDGPGIPEKYKDRIFGMFQKLQGRDQREGSGMGLALVQKLVKSRGGEVWVENSEGKRGCTFKFTWLKTQPKKSIIPNLKGA